MNHFNNHWIIACLLVFSLNLWSQNTAAESTVSFPSADGGIVHALSYPGDKHAVVLAHGAIFNKESWASFARQLVKQRLSVLAIDFRGYGRSSAGKLSTGGLYADILGAVTYLRSQGKSTITVLGASMGGGAAAQAAVHANKGDINQLILLSPTPISNPEAMKADSFLYLASENEGLAKSVESQYKQTPDPKQLQWLKGSAHAQHIFKTPHAQVLIQAIISFILGS